MNHSLRNTLTFLAQVSKPRRESGPQLGSLGNLLVQQSDLVDPLRCRLFETSLTFCVLLCGFFLDVEVLTAMAPNALVAYLLAQLR